MSFLEYLKDKVLMLTLQIILIVFMGFTLTILKGTLPIVLLFCITSALILIASLFLDYAKRKIYYKKVFSTLNNIEQKQYIYSLMEEPYFYDGKILCEILKESTLSMNREISKYKVESDEFREYIERWIHEIKIPMACIDLLCENNKSQCTREIKCENFRIEEYVEQALFYARSNTVEKDYVIRHVSLIKVIKDSIKKHSTQLIACKTQLSMEDIDEKVYSDSKWLSFIVSQVISNSIKYRVDNLRLKFSTTREEDSILLKISDNGIGIAKQDLDRVFNKGFTGENGRKFVKSTGMGLYICKELCKKMNLGFTIESIEGKGTTVVIKFPIEEMVLES